MNEQQVLAALREKAAAEFDLRGPHDARGAAIWDVAAWLAEDVFPRHALHAEPVSVQLEETHGADYSGSLPGEPPSCACGYNGTPEECAVQRDEST